MSRDTGQLYVALRRHLATGEQITAVTLLSRGHSNETYLLEGMDQILRLPPSGIPLLNGLDMARQFQLYAVLGRLPGGPPVPRVFYYCDDLSVLGAPFYLVERVPGVPFDDYTVPDWVARASDTFRDALSRQYLQAYASLARLSPLDVLGPTATPVCECLRWQSLARAAGARYLVELIDRLIGQPPGESGPPAPVNGDAKMANDLWLEGRLQGVLDWELAFNGDPLAELGYMLIFFESDTHGPQPGFDLPGMWRREQVISEWERISGRSARGLDWFEAAAAAKITAILAYGHHLATVQQSSDARMAAWLPFVEQWTEVTSRLVTKAVAGKRVPR